MRKWRKLAAGRNGAGGNPGFFRLVVDSVIIWRILKSSSINGVNEMQTEIKVGSAVTIKNERGIFRVMELSESGEQAWVASGMSMLGRSVEVSRLELATPGKNGMEVGQTVLFAGRIPVRITRFARNGVWIEYWNARGQFCRERVSISILSVQEGK